MVRHVTTLLLLLELDFSTTHDRFTCQESIVWIGCSALHFFGVGNTLFLHSLFSLLLGMARLSLLGTAFFCSLHCRSFRILFCCIYTVGSASAWLGYFSPLTLRYRMDRRWGSSFLYLYSLFLTSFFSSHSLRLSESHVLHYSTGHRVVWTAARHAVR